MKRVVAFAGMVTIVAAFAPPARRVAAQDPSLLRGMQIYEEQGCAECHSIGGRGNTAGKLDNVAGQLTDDQIRQWLLDPQTMTAKRGSTRQPPMRDYSEMPDEDVEALMTYLLTLQRM